MSWLCLTLLGSAVLYCTGPCTVVVSRLGCVIFWEGTGSLVDWVTTRGTLTHNQMCTPQVLFSGADLRPVWVPPCNLSCLHHRLRSWCMVGA